MAIVKFADIIIGARGTFGGATYSANRAGPYIKPWAKSSNPKTNFQSTQRNAFAQFAAAWRDLTAAEMSDWNDYALEPAQELTNSLGETYTVPGFNWFVTLNMRRKRMGLSQLNAAPLGLSTTNVPVGNFTIDAAGEITFTFTPAQWPVASFRAFIYLAYAPSEGRDVYPTNEHYLTNPALTTSPHTVAASFTQAKFGTPITGTRWRLRVARTHLLGYQASGHVEQANIT